VEGVVGGIVVPWACILALAFVRIDLLEGGTIYSQKMIKSEGKEKVHKLLELASLVPTYGVEGCTSVEP